MESLRLTEELELHFCYLCQAHCLSSSKHCSQCDRCVFNFDHHCQWLNNCVGSRNYRSFMSLLYSALYLLCVHLAACIYSITLYIRDLNSFQANVCAFYNLDQETTAHRPFFGLQIFLAVSDFAMLLFVFQLLMFHLYLIATEQTTFMYITSKIARSKDY